MGGPCFVDVVAIAAELAIAGRSSARAASDVRLVVGKRVYSVSEDLHVISGPNGVLSMAQREVKAPGPCSPKKQPSCAVKQQRSARAADLRQQRRLTPLRAGAVPESRSAATAAFQCSPKPCGTASELSEKLRVLDPSGAAAVLIATSIVALSSAPPPAVLSILPIVLQLC